MDRSQKVSWYSENISPAVRLCFFTFTSKKDGVADEKSDSPSVYGVLRVYDFFSAQVEMSERLLCLRFALKTLACLEMKF